MSAASPGILDAIEGLAGAAPVPMPSWRA